MGMTPEGRVKNEIKKLLKAHKVWFYCPMQNGYGTVGIPDFVCCLNGLFFAIEAKAPGKRSTLTPNQANVITAIREHGGIALVIDNILPLEEFFQAYEEQHAQDS